MGNANVFKRTTIILSCLAALALFILNIYLYEEYKKLSLGAVSEPVADNKPVIEPAVETAKQTVEANPHADEIAELKTRLAAVEDELEKSDQKWADIMAEKEEEKKKEMPRALNTCPAPMRHTLMLPGIYCLHHSLKGWRDI